jgi:hypothetical protein
MKIGDRGSTQNLTGQASTTVTITADTAPGNLLIARVAVDNSGSGGAAPGLTVTDARGNTWIELGPALQDPGAANAGATCYIAYALVNVQLLTGDLVTFTWGAGNPVAKAIVIEEWTGIDQGNPVAVAAVTGNAGSATVSISISPTAGNQLVYGACAREGPAGDATTYDSDTTSGTWETLTSLATTSGTAASNQRIVGQAKSVDAAGAQTWDLTITSRDHAEIVVVFGGSGGRSQVEALQAVSRAAVY